MRAPLAALCLAASLPAGTVQSAQSSERADGFRVGLVVPSGQDDTRRIDAMRAVVAGVAGSPPRVRTFPDIASLVEAQAAGNIDYAIYSATAFAVAERLCGCVEPLVAPSSANGGAAQSVVMIGWADRVADLDGLAEARIALAGDSVAGRWAPAASLRLAGRPFDPDGDAITRTATASEAEALFVARGVDVLIGWVVEGDDVAAAQGTLRRLEDAGVAPGTLVELWRSDPIPLGVHAVRSDVDAAFRRRLTERLTELDRSDPDLHAAISGGYGGPFIAVTADAFGLARSIAETMGRSEDAPR